MGDLDEIDFGADTDAIRRWLAKRETYAGDLGDPPRGGKHRQDPPGAVDQRGLSVPDTRAAGRHVLDALVEPDPPIARPSPKPSGPAPKDPEGTASASAAAPTPRRGVPSPHAATPEHERELATSRSTNAVFRPRTAGRNLLTAVAVVSAVATAGAGYLAYQERTTISYGLAALLGLLMLVVWAVRSSTSLTELAVIRGQLEIIHGGRLEVLDLASPYTPVLVEGRPGHRGWRVSVERHDQPLLVIDASIVDPHHFMAVLQRIRPELRGDAATSAP